MDQQQYLYDDQVVEANLGEYQIVYWLTTTSSAKYHHYLLFVKVRLILLQTYNSLFIKAYLP